MQIAGREISSKRPYIVAEISGEHKGQIYRAKRLITAARDAGADAVKLQCFDPVRLAERRGGINKVCEIGPWRGRKLGDLYEETWTPQEWFPELFKLGEDSGITVFSSVFDPEDIEYLETLNCPAYKISSYESTDKSLILKAVSTKKPVIVSCEEVPDHFSDDDMLAVPLDQLKILYCVSKYPCPVDRLRLGVLAEEDREFDGLSDHTEGILASVVAAVLNAEIIEKHLTLQRSSGGPDAAFALEPKELSQLIQQVREVKRLIGP